MHKTLSPIIAILRGVKPAEVLDVAEQLITAGIETIEVPVTTPGAMESISMLAREFSYICTIGGGTVLSEKDVSDVYNAGGSLIFSPNVNASVIKRTVQHSMISVPGVATPSEAYTALDYGATALKLFPALSIGTHGLKAWRDVLPKNVFMYAVGGMDASNIAEYIAAGANGVGIGGTLYKPGTTAEDVGFHAKKLLSITQQAVHLKAISS